MVPAPTSNSQLGRARLRIRHDDHAGRGRRLLRVHRLGRSRLGHVEGIHTRRRVDGIRHRTERGHLARITFEVERPEHRRFVGVRGVDEVDARHVIRDGGLAADHRDALGLPRRLDGTSQLRRGRIGDVENAESEEVRRHVDQRVHHLDTPNLFGEGVGAEFARRGKAGHVEDPQRAVADDVGTVAVYLDEIGGTRDRRDGSELIVLPTDDRAVRDERDEGQGDQPRGLPTEARSAKVGHGLTSFAMRYSFEYVLTSRLPRTTAGVASGISLSEFLPSSLYSGPAWTTNVSPSSLMRKILPL